MHTEDKYTCYHSNKLLMNNNSIVISKKINILLSVFIASALILGPLAMGSDVFAQGGKNTANQAISQANNAANAALCAAGTLTGPACNTTTNQANANSGSNTAGQTAGGGIGTAATGGANTANQGISQSNSATTAAQCRSEDLTSEQSYS